MNNKVVKNASWIVGCHIVQAVLNLVVSMLTARYLGPSNYGLINYAASIVAFLVPVMQLGFRSTLVQEFIEKPEEEGKTLGTALGMNLFSALLGIAGVILFVSVVNYGERTTIIVCGLYSTNLIFQALEMTQYWFQSKLLSKYTSLTMLLAYVVVSLYKIYLLVTGKSIYWFAISQAIDYMIISVVLLIIYKKIGGQKLSFSFPRGKEMFSKSRFYIVSSLMVTIFQQTDRFMLKIMLDDAATGYYSAAATCAGIASFVYAAIIDSMRPTILTAKKKSQADFEKNVSRLYAIIFWLSLAQCVFMTLFADPVVNILYGEAYAPAINVLRLLVWYVTYSYFGSVRNIWILAEGKQRYLWIINLSGALLNVILNYYFIPIWGTVGAAFASFVTQFFANFVLGFIIKPIRLNNKLLLKGLNPKLVLEMRNLIK